MIKPFHTRFIIISVIALSVMITAMIFWWGYRIAGIDDPAYQGSDTGISINPLPTENLTKAIMEGSMSHDNGNYLPTNDSELPEMEGTRPTRIRHILPPIIVPFEWPEEPIPVKLIAADHTGPSFAVLDFTDNIMKIYPPENHSMFGPLDDAMLTSQGDIIAVTSQTVFFLPDADLSNEPVILRPSKSITLPGFPAYLEVLPDRSGSSLWIAQTSNKRRETLVDLIDIESGELLTTLLIKGGHYSPVGLLDDRLVLDGRNQVLLVHNDGTIESIKSCHDPSRGSLDAYMPYIVAAYSEYIACLTDHGKDLFIVDVKTDNIRKVEAPVAGTWVPFDFPGLLDINTPIVTSSDSLIIGFYPFEDMNRSLDEQRWSLYEITLDDHKTHLITEGKGRMPKGIDLRYGDNILAAWTWPDTRIHVIKRNGTGNMELLIHLPENHTVYDLVERRNS